MRVNPIDGFGVLTLTFTSKMIFPENLANIINQEAANTNVQFKSLNLVMINVDEEEIDTNLKAWKVTSVTS